LNVSKSAIAKSVSRLEERLHTRLLNRTTRSLSLTPEGQLFYQSCVKVLDELDHAAAVLASRLQKVSGRLRVSLPLSFGRVRIMPILWDLAELHPGLDLDVDFTDRRVDLIEEGIDLVVRIGELGDQATLMTRKLATNNIVMVAAPTYLTKYGRPMSADDLNAHQCLAYGSQGRSASWPIRSQSGEISRIIVQQRHSVSHGEALREAVANGMGIAVLSTWLVAEDVRSGALELLLYSDPIPVAPIHVIWPKSRDLAPKLRAAVDALVAAFSPVPPWDLNLTPT
jgi:DNA-binding transcriptional LysR family regulator